MNEQIPQINHNEQYYNTDFQPGYGMPVYGQYPQQPPQMPNHSYLQQSPLSSKTPFTSDVKEGICALLMYIPAYMYLRFMENSIAIAIIAIILAAFTECIHYKTKWATESFVWFGCYAVCTLSVVCSLGQVWDYEQKMLFIHIFIVWWILSRSGKMLEGSSGHFLPIDAFNAFVIIPFNNFFLRVRCIFYNFRQGLSSKNPDTRKYKALSILAGAICFLLFILAAWLLIGADSTFKKLVGNIFHFLKIDWNADVICSLIFSIPVGAWLFGLIAGSKRYPLDNIQKQKYSIESFLQKLKKIPTVFWICVIGLFTLLYLGFFILQGSYLFGAFTHTLPDGFIVSQYAREGFFELCKVMAVNFTVLWVVTRMASEEASHSHVFLGVCLCFLIESILFSVIAFSKLALYISCYGFTPLRLQSTWLVCVLFAGCLCWIYALITKKPIFRKWMYFGAVTISILTLI